MKVKTKLNEQDLKEIAKSLNLQVLSERKGNFINFTLKHPESVRKKETFVREGLFNSRKVNAVCLHGYTAFMIEILKKDKEAYFRSSIYPEKIDKYNIEKVYNILHGRNIGSVLYPIFYGDACFCNTEIIEQVENKLHDLTKEANIN